MVAQTYNEAMARVYADEGGYSNDAGDPGGPTNYGITIADARMYWKPNATAADVRSMPKSMAANIYDKHYAAPLDYDALPAGVDYAVLDYGINSGISRSAKVLQQIVGVPLDGIIGPATLAAVNKMAPKDIINAIYKERLQFLQSLGTWSIFGKGWSTRCKTGLVAALKMVDEYPPQPAPKATKTIIATGTVGAATAAASAYPHYALWIGLATLAVLIVGATVYKLRNN